MTKLPSTLQSLKQRIFDKCLPKSEQQSLPKKNSILLTRNKTRSTLFPSHSISLSKNRSSSLISEYSIKTSNRSSRIAKSKCIDFTNQNSLMQNLEIWDNANIKYPHCNIPQSNSTTFTIHHHHHRKAPFTTDIMSITSGNLAMLDLYAISLNDSNTNKLKINLSSLAPHLKQEQINSEQGMRGKLFSIYREIIILKIKKQKYKNIYKDTYSILNQTEKEYSFLIEILTDKLHKIKQYYKPYIDVPQITQNTNTKSYNEKMKKHKEYKELNTELTSEILKYQKMYMDAKKELINTIEETKDKIEETAHQIRNLMLKFKQLQEEQQKYYLTILKEGTDTRKEGLTWVIEALLEIQSEPSNGDFPFFLNQEQIDYLMLMAKLSLEKKQIKAMIPALLHRRRRQFEEIDELKKRITTIQDKMFELMMQEFRRYVDKYGHNNEKENTIKAQHHNTKVYAALFGTKLFV